MKSATRIAIAATASIFLATPALAHPGHVDPLGLAHGLIHPLSGLDHILAMIAVGLYAAQLGGRAVWHATGIALGSGLNQLKIGHALALRRTSGTAGALAGLAILLS